nr:PREDICTED: uncharacterized protein LOC107079739 [Lepisosteus oculatus]
MNMTRQTRVSESGAACVVCIDPFQFVTIASVCMAMFRLMFLQEETIALLPHDNYHCQQKRFSTPSIQWLMYIKHTEPIKIQHVLTMAGETAFEFNGCFFHGGSVCYCENEFNPRTNTTFGWLYRKTMVKINFLKMRGFNVQVLWEHEFRDMLVENGDLGKFLTAAQLPEPLQPRDLLFGGRTNAICLHYTAQPGEKNHYYDFTSLYPFVNKTKKYPLGHPRIIYNNFGDLKWYFGLAKVKVYPPRRLYFPVLPTKFDKKLFFTLCCTCAETKQTTPCEHSDEDRALTGVWCTPELQMALDLEYSVYNLLNLAFHTIFFLTTSKCI